MPVCRDCHGTGQRKIKREIKTRCPHCDGSKRLPDGSDCPHCDQWGEVGTGEFEIENQLCNTCWGSGQVSEGSVTAWYLVRAIPTTLLLFIGGSIVAWFAWSWLGSQLLTGLIILISYVLWGGLMYYFAEQMPDLGEISVTNWFLIRAIPTTLTALGVGGSIAWLTWVYLQNAPVTAILIIAFLAIWGILMYYFISHLPE